MDASEALLRAFALRLALLALTVFGAQNLPDNRSQGDTGERTAMAFSNHQAAAGR